MPDPLDETQPAPIEAPTPLPSPDPQPPAPAPLPTAVAEVAAPAPSSWQSVRTSPNFEALTPEKQLVTFDRWHTRARAFAEKQPNWAQIQTAFEAGATMTKDTLSKSAGGISADDARVQIATAKLNDRKAQLGVSELDGPTTRDVLKSAGIDVAKAYLDHISTPESRTLIQNGRDFGRGFNAEILNLPARAVEAVAGGLSDSFLPKAGVTDGTTLPGRPQTPFNPADLSGNPAPGRLPSARDILAAQEASGKVPEGTYDAATKLANEGLGAISTAFGAVEHNAGDSQQRMRKAFGLGTGHDSGAAEFGMSLGKAPDMLVPVVGLGLMLAESRESGKNAALAAGKSREEASAEGDQALFKAAAALPLYGIQGGVATELLKRYLPEATPKLVKVVSTVIAHSAANVAASGELRVAEGHPFFSLESLPMDIGFALGAGKHAAAEHNFEVRKADITAKTENLKAVDSPETAKAFEEVATQNALDEADAATAPPAKEAPPSSVPEITPEETKRAADAADAANAKVELRIDGPVLVDPAGKIIARGKNGDTHEDLMRAALEKPDTDPTAVLDAFAADEQHKFGDNLDSNAAHDRVAAHVIAGDAGQVPKVKGGKLHSEMLKAEVPIVAPEPPPLTDATVLGNTEAQGKQIASELGVEFKGVQKGASKNGVTLPGHFVFEDRDGGTGNLAGGEGQTFAEVKARLENKRKPAPEAPATAADIIPAADPHAELATHGYEIDEATGNLMQITPDDLKPLTKKQLAKLSPEVTALVERAKGAAPVEPPVAAPAALTLSERAVTPEEITGEMYGESKWTHVIDVTDSTGKSVGKIRGDVTPEGFQVRGANIEATERGKGVYQRVIKQLADKYGSVHSDTDTQPAAEAAWKKVGAEVQPDGSYMLRKAGAEPVASAKPDVAPPVASEITDATFRDPTKVAESLAALKPGEKLFIPDEIADESDTKMDPSIEFTFDKEAGKYYVTGVKPAEVAPKGKAAKRRANDEVRLTPDELVASAVEDGVVPENHQELQKVAGDNAASSALVERIKAELAKAYPPETLPPGAEQSTTVSPANGKHQMKFISEDTGRKDSDGNAIKVTRPLWTNNPVDVAYLLDAGRADIYVPDGVAVNPRIKVEPDRATGQRRAVSARIPEFGVIENTGQLEAARIASTRVRENRLQQTKGKEGKLAAETDERQAELDALPPAGGSLEAEAAMMKGLLDNVMSRVDSDTGNFDKDRLKLALPKHLQFLLRSGKQPSEISPWRTFTNLRNSLIKLRLDAAKFNEGATTSIDAPIGSDGKNTRHDLIKDEGQAALDEQRLGTQADFDYEGEPNAMEDYLHENGYDPSVMSTAPDEPPSGAVAIGADKTPSKKGSRDNRDLVAHNMQALERLRIFKPGDAGKLGKTMVADPVGAALKSMAADPRGDRWLQEISRLLIDSGFETSNIELRTSNNPNANWAGTQEHASGGTDVTRSVITLNTGVRSINSIMHTVLHEVVHHVTVAKLDPYYTRTAGEERAYQALIKLHDHVSRKIFESIHGREATPEELTDFQKANGKNGANRDLYGVSNIKEFVTEILTNPRFMRIVDGLSAAGLEEKPSGKFKGLLAVVRQFIKNLTVGKPVTPGSPLDHSIEAAMTMATSGESSQNRAEEHYIRKWNEENPEELATYNDGTLPSTAPNLDASNRQEQAAQMEYLKKIATEHGFAGVNELAAGSPDLFKKATETFRAEQNSPAARSSLPPIEQSASPGATEEAPVSRGEKAAVEELLKEQFGKAIAPAPVSEQATMQRRQTTAMAGQLEAHTPFVSEQLRKNEYLSSTNAIDKTTVSDYLKKSVDAGLTLDQMIHEIDSATTFDLNLDKAQRALARAGVAMAAEKTGLKIADSIAKGEPIYNARGETLNMPVLEKQRLVQHYLETAVEQNRKVQVDVLSEAGSILSRVGGLLARTFSPHATKQEYRGPVEAAQAKVLGADAGTQAVKGAILAGKQAGAEAAVTRGDKILKNLVGLDQKTSEFFDKVWAKQVADATGFPVTIDAANKAAKNIVEQFLLSQHPGDGPQKQLIDTLRAKLESRVASQINERLTAKPERPEITPEEQINRNIKSLVEETDVAGLMERAFNSATADLMETGELTPVQATKLSEGFDFGKLDSAQRLVRDFSNMRDLVKRHLMDRDASKATLIQSVLEQSPQLRTEQAEVVAKALSSAFDLAAKAETQLQITQLLKDKTINRVKPEMVPELLSLANLGAYEDGALYNQIVANNPQLKLPVLDAAFLEHMNTETERIQQLPADSDMRRTALLKLQSEISWKHAKELLNGRSKVAYYVGKVGPAIWQAGVLSGPPTQEVNFLSTLTNVHLQGFFSALGHSISALKNGVPASEVGSFFTDSMVAWWDAAGIAKLVPLLTGGRIEAGRMGPAASAVEFGRQLKTGTSKFRSEKGEGAGILEQYKLSNFDPRGFHKFVLRLSGALDGFNSVTANEMQQRLAMRHALLLKGERGLELRAKMQDAFNPSLEVHQEIADQVAAEAAAGAFAEGKDGAREQKIRTLELLENRRDDILPGVKLEGRDAAEDWTFNKQPIGVVGAIFDGAFGQINRAVPAGKFFFSFMRTTANLINTSLDFSPVGIARAKNVSLSSTMNPKNRYYSRIEPGTPEYYNKMSQGLLGTVAIAAVGGALWAGIQALQRGEEPFFMVYGAGPSTSLEREQLKQGDQWLPNSVKIGKFRFTYTDWPVMNLTLGALGTVADGIVYGRYKDKGWGETAALAGLGIVTSVFEKRLLQGMNTIMDMVRNPDQRGLNAIKTAASGIVGGFTNPQALKWLRDTVGVDPKTGKVPDLDNGTTEGWLMSMVPASIGYNAPRINVLGDPIQHYPWDPTMRRFGNFDKFTPDPILTPLVRAGLTLPLPSKNTMIKLDNGNVATMGANPELFNAYVRYKGEALKELLDPGTVQMLSTMDHDEAADLLKGRYNQESKKMAQLRLYEDMDAGRIKATHEKSRGK